MGLVKGYLVLIIFVTHIWNHVAVGISEENEYSYETESFNTTETTTEVTKSEHEKGIKGIDVPNLMIIDKILHNLDEGACKRDLKTFVEAMTKQEHWAMSMFDASAKLPDGLLYGNAYHFGNFDECIATSAPKREIYGQYCLADVFFENNTLTVLNANNKKKSRHSFNGTIHWAFCLPNTCAPGDTKIVVKELLKSIANSDAILVEVPQLNCYKDETVALTNLEIAYGSSIAAFLLFVLMATGYHIFHIHRKTHSSQYSLDMSRKDYCIMHQITLAFSLVRNVQKILQVRVKNNDNNLDAISGIKTISMGFILAGHALLFLVSSPAINTAFLEEEVEKIQNAIFLNNPLLVDSFLLLSGFLMCRLFLLEIEKRKRINIFYLYLARYLRLTPAYLVVLGFYTTYFVRIGSGPLWNQRILVEKERCLDSWWTNLLYINNYYKTENLCMFQSWYLSVDTQLFVVAPFVVSTLWLKRRIGIILLIVIFMVTAIVPFLWTYFYKLDATLMIYAPEMKDLALNYYFINAYIKTHMRANAYVFGLVFGYLVHRIQSSGYKFPSFLKKLGWLVATIFGLSSLFSITIFYSPNHSYNLLEAALYSTLHRILWCTAVGWTILMCVSCNFGLINTFLSWKLWGPLSRLAYCSYLVNGIIELYSAGSVRVQKYLSLFDLAAETTSHIVLTVVLAFVVCVLFESPIHNIEKILLKKYAAKKKDSHYVTSNENVFS